MPVFLYSCGNSTDAELPDISGSNNIKLYYKTDFDSTGRQLIRSKELNDPGSVSKIKDIIDYDPFSYLYCVSTGSMSFYKDSVLITTMVFNTDPGQTHIACNYNGKVVAIKLSEENAKLLESFKN
ncbi:MAG: hypothetical protein ABI462_02985 [Ignavibacteria bacterium]